MTCIDIALQTVCFQASKPDATIAIDSDMHIDVEEPTHSSDDTRNQLGSNKKKQGSSGRKAKSQQSESPSIQRVASESSDSEVHLISNRSPQHSICQSKHKISARGGIKKSANRRIAERILMSVKKGQREVAPSDSNSGGCLWPRDTKLRSGTRSGHTNSVASSQQNSPNTRSSRKKDTPQLEKNEKNSALSEDLNDSTDETNNKHSATDGHDSLRIEDVNENRQEAKCRSWKVIEQGLLVKGLEIFGRNRLDPSPDNLLVVQLPCT
jgi:histone-lysine N-methyltransferase EZH2